MSNQPDQDLEINFWVTAILALAPPLFAGASFIGGCWWFTPAALFRNYCLGQ
ncbi:hypothetical protein GA0061098_1009184 [Bradyrhizobium shewense]|uniref:Uncharacterized protein n=1 Tax=Bradyrhizobium shewense TaxID=1761772 RepID=A0A1C3WS01_9BRAD|nr:hypothetical protein [Bradyrhizobium shewense]SCB42817.1 hypothetical protein GA0061098_1009184 [Bradyrhizobium shewense]